jgi:hypothetical protein
MTRNTSHSSKCKVVKLKELPDSMYKIIIVYEIEAAGASLIAE